MTDIFHEVFRPCDGREYMPTHVCSGPGAWNHTLLNKRKYQGCSEKRYFDQAINLSWVCQKFHAEYGETKKYREWFKQRQIFRYGRAAVKKFYDDAPMKIKECL